MNFIYKNTIFVLNSVYFNKIIIRSNISNSSNNLFDKNILNDKKNIDKTYNMTERNNCVPEQNICISKPNGSVCNNRGVEKFWCKECKTYK